MTYEQWDFIADTYIPILALMNILLMAFSAKLRTWGNLRQWIQTLFISILLVYLCMWLDQVLEIWPKFNSDFSTHTALAFALVWPWQRHSKPLSLFGYASLFLYFVLMNFQHYHTWLDMISTLVFMAMVFQTSTWAMGRIATLKNLKIKKPDTQ